MSWLRGPVASQMFAVSKLQQCFPPLWLNIPHSLQELERAEPGSRDLPLKLTLIDVGLCLKGYQWTSVVPEMITSNSSAQFRYTHRLSSSAIRPEWELPVVFRTLALSRMAGHRSVKCLHWLPTAKSFRSTDASA
ncbi:hypothetical protein NQZ68_002878 [Dissostichus eleginoides]|nr:hypothetical protein NQZ68_002878 [Dissostichus eleginoides]